MPTDSSSTRSAETATEEARFNFLVWWRRIDEPWSPSAETVRVACGLFVIMMVLIAVFRHRPEEPTIITGRLLFIGYGIFGMLVIEHASTRWQRIYVSLLAIALPLFALYASLTAGSAPDTLGFAALAILCPMFFMLTISDLFAVVLMLIAGHGTLLALLPEPSIGLANHWILWSSTVLLGASVAFSLLVYRSHVRQSERMLERARDQATASAQARSELLASMGDEIRTPMNGITGLIDLVLDTELTSEQRRYLEMVKSDAHRLTNVLSDLLDLAKMHAQWLELENRTFNLPDLLRATLTPMALRAEDKKVVLEWEMPRNLPVWVRGDAARLRQILVNLVNYLIEFAQASQVSVIAARMGTRHKRDYVKIEIHDRKGSLEQEEQVFIREAFDGLESAPARSMRKSGLGLAICAQLVRMMDGEIGLDITARGNVLWFTIRLPMDRDKEREAASKSARSERGAGFSVNILVVEDNPTNRVFAERVLQKAGHAVATARNGQEALDILAERDFDIVFMDILMPVMNGLEAARKIRARERENGDGTRVPIVALTAHVLEEQRQQCLDAGMDLHLGKPVHGSDLLDVVHRLVERDTSEPTASQHAEERPNLARATADSGTGTPEHTSATSSDEVTRAEEPLVFDLERLLDMLGGDRALVGELLREFMVQRVELMDELRQALARGDADAGTKLAHKLKGSLLALCADAAADLAKALEMTLRAGDLSEGQELFARLDDALDTLHETIATLPRS